MNWAWWDTRPTNQIKNMVINWIYNILINRKAVLILMTTLVHRGQNFLIWGRPYPSLWLGFLMNQQRRQLHCGWCWCAVRNYSCCIEHLRWGSRQASCFACWEDHCGWLQSSWWLFEQARRSPLWGSILPTVNTAYYQCCEMAWVGTVTGRRGAGVWCGAEWRFEVI